MKICILLRHFDTTIFEGVIALYLGIFQSKVCMRNSSYILSGLGLWCVTFNNISVVSWQSVLLVEETGIPGENHRPATSH